MTSLALPPSTSISYLAPSTPAIEVDVENERRWDAWIAEGLLHDRRMIRRMGGVWSLVIVALITWSVWAFAR